MARTRGCASSPSPRLQPKRPVRTMTVVVVDIDAEHTLRCPRPTISSQSRHSARAVLILRSAKAFALGACTGVSSTSAPSERNTSSKLGENFVSRSRSTKRSRRLRSSNIRSRFRACWVTQAPSGLAVTLLHVLVECGAAWSTMRVGPGAGDQTAMPAQQRVRPDEEARPARSRQHATDGGEQGPVGRSSLGRGSWRRSTVKLVAQDEDLQILGSSAAAEQGEQLDRAAQGEVGEFRQHRVAFMTRGWGQQRHGTERPVDTDPQLIGNI
jgi:hypothetical protein